MFVRNDYIKLLTTACVLVLIGCQKEMPVYEHVSPVPAPSIAATVPPINYKGLDWDGWAPHYCALTVEEIRRELGADNLQYQKTRRYIPSEKNAEKLLKSGKVQEAIWEFQDVGNFQAADALVVRLKETLITGKFEVVKSELSGSTPIKVLEFSDGVRAVFKAGSGTPGEIAAYEVDHYLKLGLVPVTVKRRVDNGKGEKEEGSLQYFIRDSVPFNHSDILSHWNFARIKVFDFLIGNIDRHKGNFILSELQDRLVAIDHGCSLIPDGTCSDSRTVVSFLKQDPHTIQQLKSFDVVGFRAALHGLLPTIVIHLIEKRIHSLCSKLNR